MTRGVMCALITAHVNLCLGRGARSLSTYLGCSYGENRANILGRGAGYIMRER